MRVIPWAAIALPFLTSLGTTGIPSAGQTVTPSAKDVVVEIKVAPHEQPWYPAAVTPSPTPTQQQQFPGFNSQQLDRQLQRYLAFLEHNGAPDILIVGSSRALQGVDPFVLQEVLRQQGYGPLKVFNFGINGATAQVVDWLLHTLLPPDQLPRLIVWADGSRAFNSGRVDHTFNKILRSQGHQQLRAGKRPISRTAGLKVGQVCMDLLSLQLPPPPSSKNGVSPQAPRSVGPARSSSMPYCQRPIRFVVHPGTSPPAQASPHLLEALGFQIVTQQFQPERYFQNYPRVSGRFDGDYRNFNLQGPQARALENVVRLTNARKIPLVFVNLPVTATHLDQTRSFYEDQFRYQMQRVARPNRFVFLDFSKTPALMQNRYFADPSHLNQLGATAIATQLGKDLERLSLPLLRERYNELSQTTKSSADATAVTIRILSGVK